MDEQYLNAALPIELPPHMVGRVGIEPTTSGFQASNIGTVYVHLYYI